MILLGKLIVLLFSALAAGGFALVVGQRARLAVRSRRAGDRLEMIRSTIVAAVMFVCFAAATYGAIVRAIMLFVKA